MPGCAINGILSPVAGRAYDMYGPKVLLTPGFLIMLFMLWNLSHVTTDTSMYTVVLLHSGLMVGVTFVMMPLQTHGLNALPANLYPDGTALINTLLQISGSIGTALAITIMSASQNSFLKSVSNPSDPAMESISLTAGGQTAFILGIVLAILGVIMSLFMNKPTPKEQPQTQ
ncbi:hypothetical protein A1019T_02437 [Psychrobacter pasteurii]|uniref:Major facilitator superfamily (MFS) profile domain-containing protein n=2 Tax=Psychrobacter pasteurii TaxID=1945520 RepID=A0A1R4EIU3_9GAMM|nr:hypothetical protein A1019T_02437 [Psychrobacter pasteurii]